MTYVSRTVNDARNSGSSDTTSADRQRFIRRAKAQIREAVKRSINTGDIKTLEKGRIRVPVKDMDEPSLGNNPHSGTRDRVLGGNKDYVPGDLIDRPRDGQGASGKKASPDGEGEDSFAFELTPDEFYEFLFEDLALPDLVKKAMKTVTVVKRKRAGYVTQGNPSQLDIKKTFTMALARHRALGRPSNADIDQARERLLETQGSTSNQYDIEVAEDALAQLLTRQKSVSLIDDIDLRYRNFPPHPEPITKAVMFCILDVSGSMDEQRKDLAKRFFLLLYVFLMRQYKQQVEIVFISHHTVAKEVTEEEFFYGKETGGTVVSTAVKKMKEIIRDRYSPNDYNIYAVHSSDGDNWESDNGDVIKEMDTALPNLQFFGYMQVTDDEGYGSNLWPTYGTLEDSHKNVHRVRATEPGQIWPVFRELFNKER